MGTVRLECRVWYQVSQLETALLPEWGVGSELGSALETWFQQISAQALLGMAG